MKERSPQQLSEIMKYMGIAMAVLYIFLGFFMIAYGRQSFSIAPQLVMPFGMMLIGYGGFRAYRTYKKYFKRTTKYETDDDTD
jgi:hypothetical protein